MVAPNSVTISGNITDDAELRFTLSGTAVANFTVASTPRTFDRTTARWEDGETLFMRVTAWGSLAENSAESLLRGTRVLVTGHLEQRNYETKEGEKRVSYDLIADDVAPSLLFASAEVTKNPPKQQEEPSRPTARKGTSARPAKKAAATRRTSKPAAEGDPWSDEPPF